MVFAVELAIIMARLYGGVCYAGIDTDPELKYPKGAGRVSFSSQQSYIAAISARFVQLQLGDIDKRVRIVQQLLLSYHHCLSLFILVSYELRQVIGKLIVIIACAVVIVVFSVISVFIICENYFGKMTVVVSR